MGNFGWVIEGVFKAAYRPMVDLLLRHPQVRCGLHYSGPLLAWLSEQHPEFLADVRALADRGQVEILGGGLYEPVLAAIPEADRRGQLIRMTGEVQRLLGHRPHGAWLAERVWEPSLPAALGDAGLDWTIVDDAHLRAAAIPDEEHWGAYTTDDQGRRITIFPSEQGLRYLVPFQPVDAVIAHLRAHATPDGSRLGMMGDDGEKFGAWPTTFEHCWGRGNWMPEFFAALEANADWLTTVRPTDWLTSHAPLGRVYLPTSSYTEMTEWVLPPADAILFEQALHAAQAAGRPEAKFLRGGFWRNFQRRYREINDLHKQMLRASASVSPMPPGADRDRALDHLYQGQSNDCYWHGLFGGIYISHMRLATLEHLIAAQDLADSVAVGAGRQPRTARLADVDLDGTDEALLEAPGQVVTVKLDAGAAIAGWDLRAPRHALTGVMRRRPEAYHARLRAAAEEGHLKVASAAGEADPAQDGPAVESIHGTVKAREANLESRLFYDAYERRSGLVHFLAEDAGVDSLIDGSVVERADILDDAYDLVELSEERLVARREATVGGAGRQQAIRIEKTISLAGDRRNPSLGVSIRLENRSDSGLAGRLALEWNITMLGGGGNPAAWYEIAGERRPHDSSGTAAGVRRVISGNTWIGVTLTTDAEPAADAWWYPIETVSNSENGFERSYQGSSLVLSWPVRLGPGEQATFQVRHEVATSRDRAAEEAG